MNIINVIPKRFHEISTVLALLVAIVSVWFQIRENKPELTIEVLSNDELTELSTTPNLSASFRFNDSEVEHLWKLTFRIQNTGDVTLVGRGDRSSLLESSIPISFGSDYKIVDFEVTYNDLNLSIEKASESLVNLNFDQWVSDESATVVAYVESPSYPEVKPFPSPTTRSIINGEVLTIDSSTTSSGNNDTPLISYPEEIRKIAGSIVLFFFVVALVMLIMLAFMAPFGLFKYRVWRKKNAEIYENHIDEIFASDSKEKIIDRVIERYKRDPEKLPEFMWKDFQGERFTGTLLTETVKGTMIFSTLSLLTVASVFVLFTGL